MKLAVIFLCLSVANFIGTSGAFGGLLGGGAKAKKLGTVEVSAIVFSLGQVLKICNCMKTCDESEIPIRKKDACKAIMEHLNLVSNILTVALVDVLVTLDYTVLQLKAIMSWRADDILEAFDGNIDPLLAAAVNLTQCVCAAAGVLLKTALEVVFGILGLENLISFCPGLLDTIEEILDVSSALLSVIGLLTLVSGITSIVTGIAGVVGGVAGGLLGGVLGGLGSLLGGKSC